MARRWKVEDRPDAPEIIEREIERTQDSIGETVEKVEQKLTPAEISRYFFGDDGRDMVREGLQLVRTNPVPSAMIAIGAIWLFATSSPQLMRRVGDRLSNRTRAGRQEGDEQMRSGRVPVGPPPLGGEEFDRRAQGVS
jgi:hypothetical protein